MKLILSQRSTPTWQGTGRDSRIVSVGADRDVYSFRGSIVTYAYDWAIEQWVRTTRPEPEVFAVAA